MPFEVGDKVVYPHHGAATIERRETRTFNGEEKEYLVLRLAYGDLTLSVPSENADKVGLRDVIMMKRLRKCLPCFERRKPACLPTGHGGSRTTSKS